MSVTEPTYVGPDQRSAIPGIGIEVLTMDPVLVLVLGIDLSHLEVLVLVLVLGIDLDLMEVLLLVLGIGLLCSNFQIEQVSNRAATMVQCRTATRVFCYYRWVL